MIAAVVVIGYGRAAEAFVLGNIHYLEVAGGISGLALVGHGGIAIHEDQSLTKRMLPRPFIE